ncbi:MAG TPA: sulfatase-like hydrolase/transferase [Sandaracinaceae bacterium LLY-WYZ-13_1]|nr:sulfatase-like hydrolase/transferase [Sandaracinaceae bacterium LLY-WYZ-13_1]
MDAEEDGTRAAGSAGAGAAGAGAGPRAALVPEQVMAGVLTGLLMASADAVRCALNETAPRVGVGEFLASILHLVAFYLPLGLGLGLAGAGLIALFRATPALTPLRERLAAPKRLVRNDASGFASGLGLVAALAVVVFASRAIHELLVSRVHRADLAAWAMGGLAVAVLLAAALGWALVSAILRPIARRLGPVASLGVLGGLALVGLATGATLFLRGRPQILEAYGLAPLLWGPAALLVHLALTPLVRRVLRGRGRRVWLLPEVALGVTLIGFVVSGLTYASSNRVRSVVEQRSVLGRPLVRRYAELADMDGDGHAWAFGGRDCDDLDADVHPGAFDEPGDGVDADCFAGDGSPNVADLGDGLYGTRPPALPARPNVLLITIDALRPDHLGAAGYERDTSPNLDRFAAESVRFETVLAQSSRSLRSISVMMTGKYPSQIAFGPEYLWPALLPENTTLAELLQRRGYQTAVTMGTDYFHRVDGFFQGFSDVDEILVYKPPRQRTTDQAIRQLRGLADDPRPFFQWIHLFNVHAPYLDPSAPSRYGDERVDEYDTEIRLADEQFQRILQTVEDLDLRRNTVIVVASDHGEAFGEHGTNGHSTTLYEEELRSTLIVRVPGVDPGVVETPVALFDVAPTVLNLASIDVPEPMPARSLLPLMTGEREPDPERVIFSELMPDGLFPFDIKAMRRGDEKLIWWVQDGTFQLFDLAEDPGEREDLSDERRERALEMLGMLQAWVAETNRPENRTDEFVDVHRVEAPPEEMTHPLDGRLPGVFTLLGCNPPRTDFHPGETVDLECFYRVDDETDLDLFFRVMLDPPAGYRMPPHFHALHYPLHSRYHTNQWQEGEILHDPMPMVVPPEMRTPVELRLTFAVQVRGQGLMRLQHAGRAVHSVPIDSIRILPADGADGG